MKSKHTCIGFDRQLIIVFSLLGGSLLFSPELACALQTHGGGEGLYVHQGAHVFFLVAMIIFAIHIHKSKLSQKKSWRYWVAGIWLLALWNIWAFSGHILTLIIPSSHIIEQADNNPPLLLMASWREILYYVFKMDNLLSVPAVFLLFLGLRSMLADSEPDRKTWE